MTSNLLTWAIIVYVLLLVALAEKPDMDARLYGKFHLSVTNYTQCIGAKRRGAVEVNATWIKNPDGTDDFIMYAHVKRSVGPLASRMKLYKYVNDVPKLTLEYRIKNICQHFLGKEAIKYMPKTDSRCYLVKGKVRYEMRDYNTLMQTYFGDQFFYGKFLFHTDYFSEKDEIVCNKIFVDITPSH